MPRIFMTGCLAVALILAFAPPSIAHSGTGGERWKAPSLNSKRETTTGRDVEYRKYSPGHPHYGTASRKKGDTGGSATKSKHDAAMPAIQNTR